MHTLWGSFKLFDPTSIVSIYITRIYIKYNIYTILNKYSFRVGIKNVLARVSQWLKYWHDKKVAGSCPAVESIYSMFLLF